MLNKSIIRVETPDINLGQEEEELVEELEAQDGAPGRYLQNNLGFYVELADRSGSLGIRLRSQRLGVPFTGVWCKAISVVSISLAVVSFKRRHF